MNKKIYLGMVLTVGLTVLSSSVFADVLASPEVPINITSPATSSKEHLEAASLHKKHMKFHKEMAAYNKSLAAEYVKPEHQKLKKQYEAIANNHESLAKEHEDMAFIHEKMACMSDTNSTCDDSYDSKELCCARYAADPDKNKE